MAVKQGFDPVPSTLVIGEEVDRGSFGVVYLATMDKKSVAVKQFHKTLMDSAGPGENVPLKNFKTECERLKDLNHPNVVRYIGAYEDKKGPLLVMELMYESLEKYLKRNKGRLSPERVLEICSSVCEGMAYLHGRDKPLIHRDLGSKNVLLTKQGVVKIADFGQSKLLQNIEQPLATTQPGTVLYMPPEAVDSKTVYTAKVDSFSLGVLLLEICTQRPPASGLKNIDAVIEVIRREEDLSLLDDAHPLKPLIVWCLQHEKLRPAVSVIHNHVKNVWAASNLESIRRELKKMNTETNWSLFDEKKNLELKLSEAMEARSFASQRIVELEQENQTLKKQIEDTQQELRQFSLIFGYPYQYGVSHISSPTSFPSRISNTDTLFSGHRDQYGMSHIPSPTSFSSRMRNTNALPLQFSGYPNQYGVSHIPSPYAFSSRWNSNNTLFSGYPHQNVVSHISSPTSFSSRRSNTDTLLKSLDKSKEMADGMAKKMTNLEAVHQKQEADYHKQEATLRNQLEDLNVSSEAECVAKQRDVEGLKTIKEAYWSPLDDKNDVGLKLREATKAKDSASQHTVELERENKTLKKEIEDTQQRSLQSPQVSGEPTSHDRVVHISPTSSGRRRTKSSTYKGPIGFRHSTYEDQTDNISSAMPRGRSHSTSVHATSVNVSEGFPKPAVLEQTGHVLSTILQERINTIQPKVSEGYPEPAVLDQTGRVSSIPQEKSNTIQPNPFNSDELHKKLMKRRVMIGDTQPDNSCGHLTAADHDEEPRNQSDSVKSSSEAVTKSNLSSPRPPPVKPKPKKLT